LKIEKSCIDLRVYTSYAQLKKASRTNSTFGFCRHESQRRKTKRAVFCQRFDRNKKLICKMRNLKNAVTTEKLK
jgi:hypothetical protein